MKQIITITSLAIALAAFNALAEEAATTSAAATTTTVVAPPAGPRGQDAKEQRRPVMPLIAALDANKDGIIDAEEITNASAALKTLDKNNDGKLTAEELRPPRPAGQEGGANRPERGPRKHEAGNGLEPAPAKAFKD